MSKNIMEWLATGDTGISSKAIVYAAKGLDIDTFWNWGPLDPDDLRRCMVVMRDYPCTKRGLTKLAATKQDWAALAAKWEVLKESLISEIGDLDCRNRRAPKTYAMMREIRESLK